MDLASARGREIAGRQAQLVQQQGLARLRNAMDRIEPQAVEAIVLEPVQAHSRSRRRGPRHPVVDGLSPGRARRHEEVGRVAGQIISLRAEMVVDDVEKHHQAAQMRFINQRLEVFRPSVAAVRRIEQHAVIAPIAPPGEIGDRHQLDRGQAGLDHMVELLDRAAKAAGRRERAHMQLEQHGIVPRPAAPIRRLARRSDP